MTPHSPPTDTSERDFLLSDYEDRVKVLDELQAMLGIETDYMALPDAVAMLMDDERPSARPTDTAFSAALLRLQNLAEFKRSRSAMRLASQDREDDLADAQAIETVCAAFPTDHDAMAAMQEDIAEMLRALGLSDHARSTSPHHVVRDEVLPAIRALATDRELLDQCRTAMRSIGRDYHLVDVAADRAKKAGHAERAERLEHVYGRLYWMDFALGTLQERVDADLSVSPSSRNAE